MSELKRIENGVVKFTGECFIIPNHASLVKDAFWDFQYQEKMKEQYRIILENNLPAIDENTRMVQLWILSDDLETDNLCDHAGAFINENGERAAIFNLTCMYLSSIFDGKKEGDQVHLIVPAVAVVYDESAEDRMAKSDIKLDMTLTLSQTKYRYSKFGRFEEVLEKVCKRIEK